MTPLASMVDETLGALAHRSRRQDPAVARAALAVFLLGSDPGACVICGRTLVTTMHLAPVCYSCTNVVGARELSWWTLAQCVLDARSGAPAVRPLRAAPRPSARGRAPSILIVACHLHGLPMPENA